MMELVWQEDARGERQLELWQGGRKVCGFVDVRDQRAIERLVAEGGAR